MSLIFECDILAEPDVSFSPQFESSEYQFLPLLFDVLNPEFISPFLFEYSLAHPKT